MALRNRDQTNVEPDVAEQPASPWTRPGFVASAVLVLAIVVAGIVLSTTHGGSKAPKAAVPTETPASPSTSHVAVAGSDSICGLPNGSQDVPTGPPATTWVLVGTMASPTSASYGPGSTSPQGVRTCFAHMPYGALFAAADFGAELEATSDSAAAAKALIEATVYPDAGQQSALADVASSSGGASDGAGDVRTQWAGYRFVDYTSARCTVELVIRSTSGSNAGAMVSVDYTLAWSAGDWKIVYSPSDATQPGGQVSSLAGYVAWSGA